MFGNLLIATCNRDFFRELRHANAPFSGSTQSHVCRAIQLRRFGCRRSAAIILALFSFLLAEGTAHGQRPETSPVHVGGFAPNGGRSTLTDSWGSLAIELMNSDNVDH